MPHFKNKLYEIQKVIRDQAGTPVLVLKRLGKSKLHTLRLNDSEIERIVNDLKELPKVTLKT